VRKVQRKLILNYYHITMKIEIKQGQIWQVTTNEFLTSGKDGNKTFNRQLKINKGEFIEIRYPFAWHFRTEDNLYLHAEPDMIIENCKHVGDIWEKVRWNNKANLAEIINLHLYDNI
jgi:hypothetical protein